MSFGLFAVLVATAQVAPPPAEQPPAALAPPAQYQASYDDPMLAALAPPPRALHSWSEALALLQQRSTDLRSAQAGVARAEGRWRQALSSLLPNARLTASGIHDLLNPDSPALFGGGAGAAGGGGGAVFAGGATAPVGTASAQVTQSLIDVGAWRGVASASRAEKSAEANLAEVRRRVVAGLARALVALVSAERAAELNRVGLRQALERFGLTERTQQLGAATVLDVVRVRQDVEVARGALIFGDEQLRRAREALGLAVGDDEEVGVSSGFTLEGLFDGARATCAPLASALDRADLVSAREQVDSARTSRQQASAGYLPTLGLSSNAFGLTTNEGFGRVATWTIQAVLSVPLWEGGLREGLTRERAGIERQAAEAFEAARRQAQVETVRAKRGVGVAEALAQAAKGARDLAERTDQLTRRSFEIGRASSLELVQTAAALRQADLTLALREFELVQARLDAYLTEARCDW